MDYSLVGDGKLARHLAHYLDLLGIGYERCPHRGSSPLQGRVVLLAISDDAVIPWLREHGTRDQAFVHFSGSLVTDLATGCHPLMSFGPELYAEELYRRIPFVCDREGVPFASLFPKLPNPHHTIQRAEKARYHALCVLAGNGSVLLWQKLFAELETRFGIPRADGQPYLRRIFENLLADPATALTGPWPRRDHETLARDRAALRGDAYAEVFRALGDAYFHDTGRST